MFMLPWLVTPIGRVLMALVAGAAILAAVYLKINSDAEQRVEAQSTKQTLERVNEAVRAGDRIDDPERVRELDKKYCRDC